MSKYILSYLRLVLILGALIILYIFNNHPVSLVLLIVGLSIPVFSVLFFLFFGRKCSVALSFRQSMLNRNAKGNLVVTIVNHSAYPHSKFNVFFRIRNAFGAEAYIHKISFYVGPYKTEEYVLPVSFKYCGLYRAELVKFASTDLFDLAGFTKTEQSVSEVVIMPHVAELSGSLDQITGTGEEEDDYTEEHGRGEDRSEIFDIREYAVGDKLQTIHWKLSAKSEQLLVKEFSDLSGDRFQILAELSYTDNREMDSFFDLLWTVTQYFCKMRMKFSVCYLDSKDSLQRIGIHQEEDIVSVIMQLYYENPRKEEDLSVKQVLQSDMTSKNAYLISNRAYSRNEGFTVVCSNQNSARLYRVS